MEYVFKITPHPKPRMTRADAWKKRPAVLSYWAFKDELNLLAKKQKFDATLYSSFVLAFEIPMPKSWSKKQRAKMEFAHHQTKPDIDNLIKAFFDCLLEDDSKIWAVCAEKSWTPDPIGKIYVKPDSESIMLM